MLSNEEIKEKLRELMLEMYNDSQLNHCGYHKFDHFSSLFEYYEDDIDNLIKEVKS